MSTPHFPPDEIALKLAVSLAIGLLVGFEREWSNKDVGIRTFALTSLLGMIASLIGIPIFVAAFIAVLVLVVFVNARSLLVDRSLEVTTSAALLVTYALGGLAGSGHMFTPVASAILMTMLLAWKTELHRFAGGIRPEEIRSAVLLGLLAFVIYPTLPNRFVDPWQLFNPREAWVAVIVVAGLGFVNYILLRLYGTRGLYWSAFLGGLVNSTAAVAELSVSLVAGGLAGMAVLMDLLTVIAMFGRNLALLAIFARATLATAVLPLAAMAGVAVFTLWRARGDAQNQSGQIELTSPLSLRVVLKFGAFFVLIEALGNIADRLFGNLGFLMVSALGGLISSATATVAAADLAARGHLSPASAGIGAVLASMSSTLVNIPLVARQVKNISITSRLIALTAAQIIAGVAVLLLQHYLHFQVR